MVAKVSNVNTRIYLDQYDLSGYLNAAEQAIKQEALVTNCFSDVGPRRIVGGHDYDTAANALLDFDDDLIDEFIHAHLALTTDHYLTHLWGANVENSIAYDFVVKLTEQPRSGAMGGVQVMPLKTVGSAGLSRGLVLRNGTISGTGQGTGRNQGATTAGQMYQAVVRVLSGVFTSITVRIQESQNDGGADPYADMTGMTTTLTQAGVTRLTTILATEAWKRVSIQAFTGTSVVLLVTGGLVTGT